jgi:uncharacterized protein YkwD
MLLCAGAPGAGAQGAAAAAVRRHSTPCRIAEESANLAPSAANARIVDAATLCLINQARRAHGLRALRFNRALQSVAVGQATDMVRGDYFGDNSPSGQTPLVRILASHYPPRATSASLLTAQNIGWGTGPNATPSGIVRAWMESPPHRRIILTAAYRDAGVGVAAGVPSVLERGRLGATYAVEFGARAF